LTNISYSATSTKAPLETELLSSWTMFQLALHKSQFLAKAQVAYGYTDENMHCAY